MSKIFVTSDTYFGRHNIIKLFKRPFSSVYEMNQKLVDNWNQKVSKNDIVYHLGNFAWDPIVASDVLEILHGKIRFIPGNSEDALLNVYKSYPKGIKLIKEQIHEISEKGLVMSHYPLEDWNGKEFETVHLHGHNPSLKTDLKKMYRVNCCIDNWGFQPVELEAIFEIIKEFKEFNSIK